MVTFLLEVDTLGIEEHSPCHIPLPLLQDTIGFGDSEQDDEQFPSLSQLTSIFPQTFLFANTILFLQDIEQLLLVSQFPYTFESHFPDHTELDEVVVVVEDDELEFLFTSL
jgi:hypothetical protein